MFNKQNLFTELEQLVKHSAFSAGAKSTLMQNLQRLKSSQLNILITGATGAGKSSTINALFDMSIAEVGYDTDPLTQDIHCYTLNNLVLWDTPGLGDGIEEDKNHSQRIIEKLAVADSSGQAMIDLVLVIVDGGTRDLGTTITLINEVLIPNLGPHPEERLIIAINQADVALKGPDAWDHQLNQPTTQASAFLERKVTSLTQRIKKATGVDISPIYYSAGYSYPGHQQRPYNLAKLLYLIVSKLPKNKRVLIANQTISKQESNWTDNDAPDYGKKTTAILWEAIIDSSTAGANIGSNIGELFGRPGEKLGAAIGGAIGGIVGGIGFLLGF
ncbi:GTPase family protein [Celerinatantimonas sp. YJH-8]|uniref:GTPase family protein n=1 Tax=Celerinatantimonas sp. YJH-8 TaxID=3228714 RepID=UPI0038C7AC3A